MKKFIALTLVVVALFSGCKSMKSDIDSLEDRVTALEASTTVTNVTFKDTQMIITYSTGKSVTLDMPSGLNGTNGTNGANGTNGTNGTNGLDGTGISGITFDQATNLLTITLTNGQSSTFKIINDGYANMVASLVSDSNGKMFLSEIKLGALPVATITYDENFNITSILSKTFHDDQIMNNFKVEKVYTNGVVSSLKFSSFAKRPGINYTTDYTAYEHYSETESGTHTSSYYEQNVNDTTYKYHALNYIQNGVYYFTVYPYVVKHTSNTPPVSTSDYYAKCKDNNNIAYRFNYLGYFGETSGGTTTYTILFCIDAKYTKTGTYNTGDIIETSSFNATCNVAGNPEKLYYGDSTYVLLTYNTANAIEKGELYNEKNDGTWVKYNTYLSFEYNTNKLLSSIWMKYDDGTDPKEVYRADFDTYGNPVKIYSIIGDVTNYYSYFDPFVTCTTDPWTNGEEVIYENGALQPIAEIEYNYKYKNFFGNTISSLFPVFQNYTVFNAPIKVSYVKDLVYGWIDYSNFNDSGYPETMTGTVMEGESISFEASLRYIKKN